MDDLSMEWRRRSERAVRRHPIAVLASLCLACGGSAGGDAANGAAAPPLPEVALPAELDRVLRDYERASAAHDSNALAALFTPDGFALVPGRPPVRGREALLPVLAERTGPLRLRPVAYAVADSVGYIVGTFGAERSASEGGKFLLALRRTGDGPWRIAADMDNANRR
jgi:ketosteroid isomerase-like protein